MSRDCLGNRMKEYECTDRFLPRLPIIARLDGRSFSKFTKGLERPFDNAFISCMDIVTAYLIEETGAIIGYTQSDEITLVLYADSIKKQILFDGKVQKLVSTIAAMASVKFNQLLPRFLPNKVELSPVFDCRCFIVPSKEEACNALLWRELDATKNSIGMLAHHHFGHHALENKSSKEKQEMLWKEKEINFNDLPARLKRGVFMRTEERTSKLPLTTLLAIPEKYRPKDGIVTRNRVVNLNVPPFVKVINKVGFVFNGEKCEILKETK